MKRKHKARLVAMGCSQKLGFDYETFSPTSKIETIRWLFSVCAELRRKIKVYDVKTAFLLLFWDKEVYMELT